MARDGSGNYSNPYPDFVSGTVINSTQVDDNNAAMATALTQSIAVDGQTTITANLPMANFKHTGVAAGVALTEYADVKSVQNATYIDCGTAGGTANALTLSPSPAITAYVAGQVFRFKAGASPSSSTATVAVSGLTAKAIEMNGAAMSATVVIEAGKHYSVKYDGTAFQATRESLAWPLPVANGGTGSITAAAARSALGLAIGTDVQAYDADNAVTDADQTFTAAQRGTITTDNDLSFDQDVTNNFQCTPAGTGALTFTNHTAGQSGNILLINTGGHAISLAATTKGDANLATTISAAGTYWLSYYDDGTNAYVVTSAVFA